MLARPGNRRLEQPAADFVPLELIADSDPELKFGRADVCETEVADDAVPSRIGRDRNEALIVHVIERAERACEPDGDATRVTQEPRM